MRIKIISRIKALKYDLGVTTRMASNTIKVDGDC